MGLSYDPTAIRYASTQEAYGYTWTLSKIEDDGSQTWKNAKGHLAVVQKVAETVRRPEPVLELKFDGTEDLQVPSEFKVDPPYSLETIAKRYSEIDAEVTKKLFDKGFFTNFATCNEPGHISDVCVYDRSLSNEEIAKVHNEGYDAVPGGKRLFSEADSGRVSSTQFNESNVQKTAQKFGYYSKQADNFGIGLCEYRTFKNTTVLVTSVGAEGSKWPDEICIGPVSELVRVVRKSKLSGAWDCGTNWIRRYSFSADKYDGRILSAIETKKAGK